MTTKTAFPPSFSPRALFSSIPGWGWQIGVALAIYLIVSYFVLAAHPEAEPQLRFTLEPLLSASVAVQVHVVAALSTFGIGLVLLYAPKGFRLHKTLGWTWVMTMAATAISSFFITGIMGSSYSPIHALSAWTMIGLPFGVAAIRRRDVQKHRHTMTGMFVGGMAIAGLFSFLPGRLMWEIFFTA